MELARILLIVCPLVFTAGFVDAIAGGGGIISLPAYLFAGLPVHFAAGCNKFSASFGTIIAAKKYFNSGKMNFKIALYSGIGAILGAWLGTNLALYIDEKTLEGLLLLALPLVAFFLATQKGFGKEVLQKDYTHKKQAVLSLIIGLTVGAYDGLIGPGTGTFLILAFSGLLGLELVTASGCAKVSNLASNLTSMLIFTLSGKVIFIIAIPAAIFSMLGGYMGAKFAIKKGSNSVRYIIFLVLGLLFLKTIMEIIN